MQHEHAPTRGRISTVRAVRHHLALVVFCIALGAFAGWLYAASMPATYTSTARVLVNPSAGNPYATTPASVRQDELTSLETEAEVVRSADVLGTVAGESPTLTTRELERGLQVTVSPNSQVLEISYTASDADAARQVADAVATTYLANRQRRFAELNAARIERVETRTQTVVTDLRAATAAAQKGSAAERLFQAELATALRNELVSLRAQRTALENLDSPSGTVIAPASSPKNAQALTAMVVPAGGALAGLALGCLLAALLERLTGVVRSRSDLEGTGLPVIAAVPAPRWTSRLVGRGAAHGFDTTVRRLRATILDREPRPEVIAVAPAGSGGSDADVSEAVAESFAKAGHRVVLVRTDGPADKGGLQVEEQGLAQALLYERMNVLDLLQPSVDPLLCILPAGGFNAQSRELLLADRVRSVLSPLVAAGHLVVLQAPGIDSVEGEAIVGAADLGIAVVRLGRTRPKEVEQVTRARTRGVPLAALVVGRRDAARRARRAPDSIYAETTKEEAVKRDVLARARR